jgi:hypothetical protein
VRQFARLTPEARRNLIDDRGGILVKIIFAIAVLLLSAAFTKAQTTGWVELQNAITTKKTVPQFDGVVDCKINDRLSFSAWFLLSEEYSEGYAGVSYTPKAWVSVSGQIGLETAENPLRVAGTIWLGKNRESLLIILEGGGSGHGIRWNITTASAPAFLPGTWIRLSRVVVLGVNSRRGKRKYGAPSYGGKMVKTHSSACVSASNETPTLANFGWHFFQGHDSSWI